MRCSAGHDAPESEFSVDLGNSRGLRYYCKKHEAERRRRDRVKRRGEHLADTLPPDARPTPPMAPPPIETARAARDDARAKRDLRNEHSALLEENEHLRAKLGEVERMARPSIVSYEPAPDIKGDAVACLVASDWHIEEPVEAHAVHGLNEYNLTIAEDRARHFFKNGLKLASICARDAHIDTLWLGLLGDFFSGFIHEELQETNLVGPGEAARIVLGFLASGIDFLLKESAFNLVIDGIPGNHGRLTKKMRHHNATETSLETFMYHALALRYADHPRVKVHVAGAPMVYRRFFERFTMRLIHGYEIQYMGGVGGVTIPIRKKIAGWDKGIKASLTVMGHFHQLLDGGDHIVNGSLIGYNSFAQAIAASPEEARQAFFLVHARNGGEKALTAPVWLNDVRGSTAP